jgi:hypothetical protein
MAIQYYMRAYNTVTKLYVDWVVNDQPDSTGLFAPGGSTNLTNITVNKVVTSSVDNFLNPAAEPSFIAPNYPNPLDGYYLHVNSFDWLNPTPPTTGTPSDPTGIAVVRGYSGGTLNPYSTLTWLETDGYWSFNQLLANGSLGAAQSVNTGSLNTYGSTTITDGYIGITEAPSYAADPWAGSGIIRIPNNQFLNSSNAAHNADIQLIGADTSNRVNVGSVANSVYIPDYLRIDGYITDGADANNTSIAQSGFIRLPANVTAVSARGQGSYDHALLGTDSSDHITLGDLSSAHNTGFVFNTSTGSEYYFAVNLTSFPTTVPGVHIGDNYIKFDTTNANPVIGQVPVPNGTSAAGSSLIVAAQSTLSSTPNVGGPLVLQSGAGTISGANTGNSHIDLGSAGQTLPMARFFPDSAEDYVNSPTDYRPYGTNTINDSSTIVFNPIVRFPQSFTNFSPLSNLFGNGGNTGVALTNTGPVIAQDDATIGNGLPMTISAQWTTAVATGGSLTVSAGSSTGSGGQGGTAKFKAGDALTGATATGGAAIVAGGNATQDSTFVNTGAGSLRAGGNVVLSPGSGSGAVGSQVHGEIDFQNAGVVVGRVYADGYVPYLELASNTASEASWHPATVGFIRLSHLPTDGYTAVGYTAVAMRNSINTGDILLLGSDINNNVVVGDGSHDVIIGGNYLNSDLSPASTTTFIAGNLQVWGTTTTVDSTVIDIVGRVIHANWPQSPGGAPPALAPPTQIVGYSVDRGYNASNVFNDGASIIWTEGTQVVSGSDGYWRFLTIPQDGYSTTPRDAYTIATLASSGSNPLSVMGLSFSSFENSGVPPYTVNPAAGLLPGVGAVRTQKGTTAVSARNAAGTLDHLLLGTDTADHIVMGSSSSPHNAGFIFNTTTNSLFDFWVNSTSEVQISSDSYGPFVRESATTFAPATVGFIRVPNATIAVAARNQSNTADLQLLGTDSSNHIVHGASSSPQNAGQIFNTTTGSIYDFWVNSVSQVQIGANAITFTGTDTAPVLSQALTSTASATGQTLTVQAQNATGTTSTGGNLVLASGIGTTVAGNIQLNTGSTVQLNITPTLNTFTNPIALSTGTVASTGSIRAANNTLIIAARNAGNTADISVLGTDSSNDIYIGGGTNVANINLNAATGNTVNAQINSVTSVSISNNAISLAQTGVAYTISQPNLTTNNGIANALTIQAQNETGTTSTGGDLTLTSGTGTSANGYINLQAGGSTTARVHTNKFIFSKGRRRNITSVTGTYTVLATDDYLAITSLSTSFTITLPSAPTVGDEYTIKDTTGNAGIYPVTVSGNGVNIDGLSSFLLNRAYIAVLFTYTGSQWSVS